MVVPPLAMPGAAAKPWAVILPRARAAARSNIGPQTDFGPLALFHFSNFLIIFKSLQSSKFV
jgi:hypothetical protein